MMKLNFTIVRLILRKTKILKWRTKKNVVIDGDIFNELFERKRGDKRDVDCAQSVDLRSGVDFEDEDSRKKIQFKLRFQKSWIEAWICISIVLHLN